MTNTVRRVVAVALGSVIGGAYGVVLDVLLRSLASASAVSPAFVCMIAGAIDGAVRKPYLGAVVAAGLAGALLVIRTLGLGVPAESLPSLAVSWLIGTVPPAVIGAALGKA